MKMTGESNSETRIAGQLVREGEGRRRRGKQSSLAHYYNMPSPKNHSHASISEGEKRESLLTSITLSRLIVLVFLRYEGLPIQGVYIYPWLASLTRKTKTHSFMDDFESMFWLLLFWMRYRGKEL
jgi:hypothetical protein